MLMTMGGIKGEGETGVTADREPNVARLAAVVVSLVPVTTMTLDSARGSPPSEVSEGGGPTVSASVVPGKVPVNWGFVGSGSVVTFVSEGVMAAALEVTTDEETGRVGKARRAGDRVPELEAPLISISGAGVRVDDQVMILDVFWRFASAGSKSSPDNDPSPLG